MTGAGAAWVSAFGPVELRMNALHLRWLCFAVSGMSAINERKTTFCVEPTAALAVLAQRFAPGYERTLKGEWSSKSDLIGDIARRPVSHPGVKCQFCGSAEMRLMSLVN
jgi:hypothetical protein